MRSDSFCKEDCRFARAFGIRNKTDDGVANTFPEAEGMVTGRLQVPQRTDRIAEQIVPRKRGTSHLIARPDEKRQGPLPGDCTLDVVDQRASVSPSPAGFIDDERVQ